MRRRPTTKRDLSPQPAVGPEELERLLEAALARRAALLADLSTDACRLFHSAADGIAGLVIEKFGDVLIAQLHEGHLAAGEEAAGHICAQAARRFGARAVYRKVYPQDRTAARPDLERQHRDPVPWFGQPVEPELAVRESGATFLVRPYDGFGTGLFLDHRLARGRLRQLASGRRVLNTFAHTCGFTVATALGGAATTVSVDISRKFLEWGKRNLAANGLAPDQHRFICSDVFDYYQRATRQRHRFDLVILDPPTFARHRQSRRTFSLTQDLERLVAGALALLDPGGIIHLSVNHRQTSLRHLATVVSAAARAQRRGCESLPAPSLPDDFRGDLDYAKSVLVRVE